MRERVQKFLSAAGAASRRKAEELIKSGQVFINGRKAKLGDKIDPNHDVVKVWGKIIKPIAQKIYIIMNKPAGYVVSRKDPRRRKTVFDLLPPGIRQKVWNVGRLDFDSEGLLILTNDGELTQRLAHPKYEHDKEYEIKANALPAETQLEKLRQGVEISTGLTYPARVKSRNGKILITIREGKKRQIRRMFKAVGLKVVNLKRIRIGKLTLPPDLTIGNYRTVKKTEII